MFEKNLQYLNNDGLKGRLRILSLDQTSKNMSYCMTPSNDYLLMKNELPIDDIKNPREAIRKHLKATIKGKMAINDIIITFGIGLCYLLDEVFNTYPARIFVYEPDIEILHFVLNNVDISEHLKSGRVYITDKLDELLTKLAMVYITKDKVEVVYLNNYAVVRNQDLLELTQKVYETCRSKIVDVNTIARYSKKWLLNTLHNIAQTKNKNCYSLSDLENKFSGKSALILAAGPSLNENIEYIKANREKYVIFAVNKVLRHLEEEGIIPDFLVCLDASFIANTLNGLEEFCSKMNCIMDLRSDNKILEKPFKKVFFTFSKNDTVAKKLSEFNPFMKLYEFGGSATTMAFISALKLGFSKIIFAGMDMAFKDDLMYSTGEEIERKANNKISIGTATKNIVHVPSVKGHPVATRDDYAAAIKHFETLIRMVDYSEIYNTTSFGAKVEGMKNQSLDSIPILESSDAATIISEDVNPIGFEVAEWAQNELMIINRIITLLSKGGYSTAIVSEIITSPLMYQYMQADIVNIIQSKFDKDLCKEFIIKTKVAIKEVIDILQKISII